MNGVCVVCILFFHLKIECYPSMGAGVGSKMLKVILVFVYYFTEKFIRMHKTEKNVVIYDIHDKTLKKSRHKWNPQYDLKKMNIIESHAKLG